MIKRNVKIYFLLILLVGITFSITTPTKAITTGVNVGLLTPMTGGLSAYSLGFEQGAQLAIDHLNNDPSFNSSYTFSLSIYDTKTTPTGAIEAMNAAVAGGMDYVVGAAGSSNTLAAASVAVSNKVPLISYASTSPALSTFDDHAVIGDEGYLWRIPASDGMQGETMADLAHQGGYRKMVIVTMDNDYGLQMANSTRQKFVDLGGKVLRTWLYEQTEPDFSITVANIKAEQPDIIVAISYSTDGARLFVEMANQNVDKPVIGSDGVAHTGIFSEHIDAQSAMQGFITLNPISPNTPEAQNFNTAYTTAFVNTAGHIYIAESYDSVMAGARAIAAKSSLAGQDIINGLSTLSFEGASGHKSFDINGDQNVGYFKFSEVRLNQMVRVGTWDSENGTKYEETDFYNRWLVPPQRVKIGLLTPMTGALSAYTQGFEQAAQLAVSHLNSDPRYVGFDFELSSFDTLTTPTGAIEAMNAAVAGGMDYVVGAAGSGNTLAAASVAVSNKVPLISYAATLPFLTGFDDHAVIGDEGYLWRTAYSDVLQGVGIAKLAWQGDFSRMTIVNVENSYGDGIAEVVSAEFQSLGGTIVSTVKYPETLLDFSGVVNQLASGNPEIIVAISYSQDAARLFVEMANQNLNIQVIGSDVVGPMEIFDELDGVNDTMQGFVFFNNNRNSFSTPEAFEFLFAYDAEYGDHSGDIFIHEVYDAVFAGAMAVKSENSTDGPNIIKGLSTVSFSGASGNVTFDENGDRTFAEYNILEVQGESMVKVGTWNTKDAITFSSSSFIERWQYIAPPVSSTSSVTSATTVVTTVTTVSTVESSSSSASTSDTSVEVPFSTLGLFAAIFFMNFIARVILRK